MAVFHFSLTRTASSRSAARYTAFSLKIPSDTNDSWISAGNIIKFYLQSRRDILKF
ncbi:Hypothetical protein FKW44_004717 [Caligus rogercresseyi]|uniref:Uncharacterized protein n=1 Tax=Caligus rogercresseyi TaxID=217165 RepID=A0A7T8HM09_CALRO|nr:Hypothetical protein FKW44_004717 [Caligus rogercresseyi]